MKNNVYISYPSNEKEIISPYLEYFKSYGIRFSIEESGESDNDFIFKKIKTASAFLCFLTYNETLSSSFLLKLRYAITKKIPVIAVFLENSNYPTWLNIMLNEQSTISANGKSIKDVCTEIISLFQPLLPKENKLLLEKTFTSPSDVQKRIRVFQGDLLSIKEQTDLLVCSAFKDDYYPLPGTLIGSLYTERNVSVRELAKNPELPSKELGAWISKELPEGNFKRIACIELLGRDFPDDDSDDDYLLQTGFSTLRFLVDQCVFKRIPVKSIAMPVLATGCQAFEFGYVLAPLLHHCLKMLSEVDQLTELTFCELNEEKAQQLTNALQTALTEKRRKEDVFISYSTKNSEYAFRIRDSLQSAGVSCWIAPDSIPVGSNYMDEIAQILFESPLFTVIVTPESENSNWVMKEMDVAFSTKCLIVPVQPKEYPLSKKFRFALACEQIFPAWQYSEQDGIEKLTEFILSQLKTYK